MCTSGGTVVVAWKCLLGCPYTHYGSMGMVYLPLFAYIWLICMVLVGKYTIHGCYGILLSKWIISPLYT